MLNMAFVVNVELGGAGCRAFGVCRCGLLLACQGRGRASRAIRVSVWLLPGVEGLEAGCGLSAPVGCGWGASGRD